MKVLIVVKDPKHRSWAVKRKLDYYIYLGAEVYVVDKDDVLLVGRGIDEFWIDELTKEE